jgi:ABC-type nitrate/sulfonate/bicarbonate transport system substrate-binding protein
VESAGTYVADARGYFRQEGFGSVEIVEGGPNDPSVVAVAEGRSFVGVTAIDVLAREILAGRQVRAVGALYQRYPFGVVSLAASPIGTPGGLVGRRIFVGKASQHIWEAFLRAANVAPHLLETVYSDDDPANAVVAGTVDAALSHIADLPLALARRDVETHTFLLADYGYPLVSAVYVVEDRSLTEHPEAIAGALAAEIRGWRDNLADPVIGTRLAVTEYGTANNLDETEQDERNRLLNTLIESDDTRRNGLLTVTPGLQAANVQALRALGYALDVEQLFDTSILDALHAARPELR